MTSVVTSRVKPKLQSRKTLAELTAARKNSKTIEKPRRISDHGVTHSANGGAWSGDFMDNICQKRGSSTEDSVIDMAIKSSRGNAHMGAVLERTSVPESLVSLPAEQPVMDVQESDAHAGTSHTPLFYRLLRQLAKEHERELMLAAGRDGHSTQKKRRENARSRECSPESRELAPERGGLTGSARHSVASSRHRYSTSASSCRSNRSSVACRKESSAYAAGQADSKNPVPQNCNNPSEPSERGSWGGQAQSRSVASNGDGSWTGQSQSQSSASNGDAGQHVPCELVVDDDIPETLQKSEHTEPVIAETDTSMKKVITVDVVSTASDASKDSSVEYVHETKVVPPDEASEASGGRPVECKIVPSPDLDESEGPIPTSFGTGQQQNASSSDNERTAPVLETPERRETKSSTWTAGDWQEHQSHQRGKSVVEDAPPPLPDDDDSSEAGSDELMSNVQSWLEDSQDVSSPSPTAPIARHSITIPDVAGGRGSPLGRQSFRKGAPPAQPAMGQRLSVGPRLSVTLGRTMSSGSKKSLNSNSSNSIGQSQKRMSFRPSVNNASDTPELHDLWEYYLFSQTDSEGKPRSQYLTKDNTDTMFFRREDSGISQNASMSMAASRLRATVARVLVRSAARVTSNPASKKRICWDVLGILLLSLDLIWLPLQVFEIQSLGFTHYFQYITMTFWACDLISCFFVGYHQKGVVEMRPSKIAVHYVRTWFSLDFSLVCLDFAITMFEVRSRSDTSTLRITKISRGVRALKLLRLVKFQAILGDIMAGVRSEYVRTLLSILKIILFIVAVNHYIACGFYGMSHAVDEGTKTWVEKNFVLKEHENIQYRYFTALHWSLTQFTPASMEVVPVNSFERVYTVTVLLFALVTFSSFVSSITTAMTHLRQINAKRIDQDSKLLKYLTDHRISPPLTSRVLHFFSERAQSGNRGLTTKEGDVELFQFLPESMKHELRWEAHKPIVTNHPMFEVFFEYNEKAARSVCNSLTSQHLMIRDELYGNSVPVSHMFFLKVGKFKYEFMVNGITTNEFVERGSWACEVCLWVKDPVDSNPFVAAAPCEMVMLWSDAFIRVIDNHPHFATQLAVYAHQFIEVAAELSKRCRKQTVLINNTDQLLSFVKHTMDMYEDEDDDDELGDEMEAEWSEKRRKRKSGGGFDTGISSPQLHWMNFFSCCFTPKKIQKKKTRASLS